MDQHTTCFISWRTLFWKPKKSIYLAQHFLSYLVRNRFLFTPATRKAFQLTCEHLIMGDSDNINISQLIAGKPKPTFKNPHFTSRLISAFFDQTIGIAFRIIIWLPFFFMIMDNEKGTNPFYMFSSVGFIITFIALSTFLYLKDINGRSIGKRTVHLQIINNKTGYPASPVRNVMRGFGFILWPIEIFMLFLSPSRRIGDFIAGTRVVQTATPSRVSFPVSHYVFAVLTGLLLSGIFYVPIYAAAELMQKTEKFKDPASVAEKTETQKLTDFIKKKYTQEFETVSFTLRGKGDGEDILIIKGALITKNTIILREEMIYLEQRLTYDLSQYFSGKEFKAEISIVNPEGSNNRIHKFNLRSDE